MAPFTKGKSATPKGQENKTRKAAKARRHIDSEDDDDDSDGGQTRSVLSMPPLRTTRPATMNLENNFEQYKKKNTGIQDILRQAVGEVRSDFRPKAKPVKSESEAGGSKKSKQSESSTATGDYSVKALVWIPHGVDDYNKKPPPKLAECNALARSKLAVVAKEKGDMVFNKNWKTKDTIAKIRELLPHPFGAMDDLAAEEEATDSGSKKRSKKRQPDPIVYLLHKSYNKFKDSVYDTMTGAEVFDTFVTKTAWGEHYIFLTGRFALDSETIDGWGTRLIDDDEVMADDPQLDAAPEVDDDSDLEMEVDPPTASPVARRPSVPSTPLPTSQRTSSKRRRQSGSSSDSDVVVIPQPTPKKRRVSRSARTAPRATVVPPTPQPPVGQTTPAPTPVIISLLDSPAMPDPSTPAPPSSAQPDAAPVLDFNLLDDANDIWIETGRPATPTRREAVRFDLSPTVARGLTKIDPYAR